MSNTVFGGGGYRIPRIVKPKIFLSYHHGGDQEYYDALCRIFCDTYDVITDNSLERRIDSDDVEYVMRRIRENYITGSSCTVVLVGSETWGRKYVDWEVKATLEKEHGLIGVQLPTAPVSLDNKVDVPGRLNDNINSGYALWVSWDVITHSTSACTQLIASAKDKNKLLIDNSRERRLAHSLRELADI